jgi:hypothetical protein
MAALRTWVIGGALALGFALVLGGPAWLAWEYMRAPVWDDGAVEARFDWVRLDHDTLVFAYWVRNHSSRKASLTRDAIRLRVLRPEGSSLAGDPAIPLPLELPPHSSQRVEVRLEPAMPGDDWREPRGRERIAGREPWTMESFQAALRNVEGFELVDGNAGIRLVFPRGW